MATKHPELADALRLIAAQGRQLESLAARVKALEQKLVPKPGKNVPRMAPEAWLAQRVELAASARRARLAKKRDSKPDSTPPAKTKPKRRGTKKGSRR